MTYTADIKKLASKDGITPNFSLLSRYSDFSEDQFYKNYLYYKSNETFVKGSLILKEFKLEKYQNELFFFLIEIVESSYEILWAKDVAKSREDERCLKQSQKLNDFCNKIQTHGGYKKSDSTKDPSIKKINFLTNKNLSITIDSHKLCVIIIELVQEHYYKNKDQILKETIKKKNLNPRQYNKQFILSLKPLINYLNKETVSWESQNKIYNFICEFVSVLNLDFDLNPTRIKDALKPKQH